MAIIVQLAPIVGLGQGLKNVLFRNPTRLGQIKCMRVPSTGMSLYYVSVRISDLIIWSFLWSYLTKGWHVAFCDTVLQRHNNPIPRVQSIKRNITNDLGEVAFFSICTSLLTNYFEVYLRNEVCQYCYLDGCFFLYRCLGSL